MGKCQTIHNVLDQLNFNSEMREITKYNITENFPKHGKNTYTLVNLTAEIEDDMIFFNDAECQLEETKVLSGFLTTSVKHVETNDKITNITLNDGNIIIEVIG